VNTEPCIPSNRSDKKFSRLARIESVTLTCSDLCRVLPTAMCDCKTWPATTKLNKIDA
jgi:hypothetical protein